MGCKDCTSGLGRNCRGPDGDAVEMDCDCACHDTTCPNCGDLLQPGETCYCQDDDYWDIDDIDDIPCPVCDGEGYMPPEKTVLMDGVRPLDRCVNCDGTGVDEL